MATHRELNVIKVGDKEFLLTVGGVEAIHLTRAASEDEESVAAVPDHYWRTCRRPTTGRC